MTIECPCCMLYFELNDFILHYKGKTCNIPKTKIDGLVMIGLMSTEERDELNNLNV